MGGFFSSRPAQPAYIVQGPDMSEAYAQARKRAITPIGRASGSQGSVPLYQPRSVGANEAALLGGWSGSQRPAAVIPGYGAGPSGFEAFLSAIAPMMSMAGMMYGLPLLQSGAGLGALGGESFGAGGAEGDLLSGMGSNPWTSDIGGGMY